MQLSTIIPHIEALIFASDKPLTNLDIVELINNAFGFMEERISLDQVESAVDGIKEKYNAEFYPFEMRQSGGGWQFLTKKDFHKTVGQLNGDKFLKRLSNAALETLAIIAYKQPITKGEVEAIRGVNSDYSVQKLLEKELIVIAGRSEELPGKPLVYTTSKSFMDYFGLNTVSDLPKIREVLSEQVVEGTIINEGMKKAEMEAEEVIPGLTVTDNGELMEYKLNPSAEGSAPKNDLDEIEDTEAETSIDAEDIDDNEDSVPLAVQSGIEEFSDTDETGEEDEAVDEEHDSVEEESTADQDEPAEPTDDTDEESTTEKED